jgi:hypothetical protein
MTIRRAGALLLIALAAPARPAEAEVRSGSFALRRGYDVGSVAVEGTDSGLGLGASLRLALGDARGAWELGLESDIAGYSGSADGDPILHLFLLVSRRWDFGRTEARTRPYLSLGAGIGLQGLATGGIPIPLRAAAGLAFFADRDVGVDLALYERFAPVHGDGDPAWEYVNSFGLELAVRFGR